MVKVSVFLPDGVHQQLKRNSVDEKTSLQKVIADLAIAAAKKNPETSPAETLESLSLVGTRQTWTPQDKINARTIKRWQDRLKHVLENGNRLAVLNCTATIEAMEMLINSNGTHSQSGGQ